MFWLIRAIHGLKPDLLLCVISGSEVFSSYSSSCNLKPASCEAHDEALSIALCAERWRQEQAPREFSLFMEDPCPPAKWLSWLVDFFRCSSLIFGLRKPVPGLTERVILTNWFQNPMRLIRLEHALNTRKKIKIYMEINFDFQINHTIKTITNTVNQERWLID